MPNGNPGAGINIAKDSGFGRKANHYYGTGLVEMLALQTRTDILLQVDTNFDGWISAAEAQAASASVDILPHPDATATIDYGNPQLDGGATGSPQFNTVHGIRVSDDGHVYVADRLNNRIQVFTIDGVFETEVFVERATRLLGTMVMQSQGQT